MKTNSIPRQLLVFIIVTAVVTFAASAMFFLMLRGAYRDSSAAASVVVTDATRSFTILDRVAAARGALQATMRLKDPDEIEKAIGELKATDAQVLELAAAAGSAGTAIREQYAKAIEAEQGVLDAFLKGDNASANEQILVVANPRFSAAQNEVRRYYAAASKATAATMAANEARGSRQMAIRFAVLAAALVALGVFMWRVRARITSDLSRLSATLLKSSDTLAATSGQVTCSSRALSQGATEQAAALEETSASMEEMASMTRRNAENARSAAQLMTDVDTRVAESNQALGEMVASMTGIEEASQKVARIIKTIDEIALQTNILALNAAVEAARAGEAGMGFAVVADEVRTLARRAAEAAKDTATLIEESIARARDGSAKVRQVSASIGAITESVVGAKGLVDQVTNASHQQTQGIDQVQQAIAQMERVTQTTAASAEEGAVSSEGLNVQAEETRAIVGELDALVGGARSRSVTTEAVGPARDFESEELHRSAA